VADVKFTLGGAAGTEFSKDITLVVRVRPGKTLQGCRFQYRPGITHTGRTHAVRVYRHSDGALIFAGPGRTIATTNGEWVSFDADLFRLEGGVDYRVGVFTGGTHQFNVFTGDEVARVVNGSDGTSFDLDGTRWAISGDAFPTSATDNAFYPSMGLRYNTGPNAPLLLSPVGGVTIDRSITQRFDWDFSDPDAGDSQSKYDLQYRAVGATAWTAVTGTTPNTFHDFAAGTFAAGDYEWQVRTYDSYGLVGPYSASGFFTAATPPTGPTITDPISGQTIGQTPYTVVWSYPTQEAYQLRTVADNAGAADPTIVYTDTGIVESTSVRSRAVAFPVNNRYEHVQVRVRDAGLWSPYTSVRVLVSYTPPAVPTATVQASNSGAAISVSITNPTPAAGEPSVAYNDVLRRQTAVGGDGIRIAANKAANGTHIDFTPASGVDYEYAVRAFADNGTASTSPWLGGTSTTDDITAYAGY
jgi:hypothetical protein